MAENGPTAATAAAADEVSARPVIVFGLSFVAGLVSLVFIGILVTMALPMLGGLAGLSLLVIGPLAGFLGSIVPDRSWRWGYGLGLTLDELAILGLQTGSDGLAAAGGLALFVVPPTVAGWLAGFYLARRLY
jgi:hypothetical protein